MDPRQKAKGAPYHLATSMEECPLGRFWVVQLDCGIEVYQTDDNPDCDEPNAWMRLKRFCEDTGCRPVNMARASQNGDPGTQINMDPMADGYFYAKRMRKLLAGSLAYSGYEDYAQGVGQLHGSILKIMWELESGHVEVETRDIHDHPKSQTPSLIRK